MKKHFLAGSTLVVSLLLSLTAFAGSWKNDAIGWWYDYGNGTYPASSWQWIDGNNDGIAECYYFNQNGYMAANTAQDGYMLNADGQWVVNGVVQTKNLGYTAAVNNTVSNSTGNSSYSGGELQSYGTTSLLDMDYVDKTTYVFKKTNQETMRNELWSKCLEFYFSDETITYYLDGKYNTLTFSYAPKKGYNVKSEATLYVYGDDDTILWESDTITSKDKTQTATVDISGQDEIRIHESYEKNYGGSILVKELTLS
ncbi:NPCBM/NEW2 domain-containing protein [Oribacterium sp. FC2011]|uniref:NPCBM/NEW2 domain-containing protein n=1 Tax=Oribacterium sp. FC2011 TaxID=1408311 RepID=UPI0006788612|nr:NPCBM/NEW2 domain-containing protein [Oribacterium sp. FC2011]